jgi:hypothetical protein
MMGAMGKYGLFVAGCVLAYFEPVGFLLRLVAVLFFVDFVTGGCQVAEGVRVVEAEVEAFAVVVCEDVGLHGRDGAYVLCVQGDPARSENSYTGYSNRR